MDPQDAQHPLSGALDAWERVVEDMEATAAEYREAGWETLELHPGDVTPIPGADVGADAPPDTDVDDGGAGGAAADRFGLDALLPGDEFDAVSAAVADASFDGYEVFRAGAGGVVFLVLAMLARDAGRAVLVPLYYSRGDAAAMVERARDAGEMRVVLRPLADDERVVFTQAEPESLLPDADPDEP